MVVNTIKIYFSKKSTEREEEKEQQQQAIHSMTPHMKHPNP